MFRTRSLSLLLAFSLLSACVTKDDDDDDSGATDEDVDADGFTADEDCDDDDPAINPDASEVCDGIDNDCDGLTDDDDDSLDTSTGEAFYGDADADGFGAADALIQACAQPTGAVTDDTDCDDDDAAINPGATEVCDDADADEDCDGDVDDADDAPDSATFTTWYMDGDSDGYGDEADAGVASCDPPTDGSDYSDDNTDCDDLIAAINPGATEVCDDADTDEDCDGTADDADASVDLSTGSTWYVDGDEDGYGDEDDAGTLACDPPSTTSDYVFENTDCDDAEITTSPASPELCGDAVDNDCDGNLDEVCQTLHQADWIVEGVDSEELGYRLDVGDVTGDGQDDLLVAALSADASDGDTNAGAVYVMAGPLTAGLSSSADAAATLEGENAYDNLCSALHVVDDMDGDGYPDVLASTSQYTDRIDGGAVYLFSGPLSGTLDGASATLRVAGEALTQLGLQLPERVGDLDGDGTPDLVVGTSSGSSGSAAYVFFGPTTGQVDVGSADATLTGESSGDGFGIATQGWLDLNSDGYSDLLVGADDVDTVYGFYGPVTGDWDSGDASMSLTGTSNSNFGASARGGDVNGDGYHDVMVGARYVSSYNGAVYLFNGPVTGGTHADAAATVEGGASGFLGSPLNQDAVEDLDGDGLDDLLISDRYDDTAGTSAGAASVFLGPVSGTIGVAAGDYRFTGEAIVRGYGGTALGVGDLDGDGVIDLALSAYQAGTDQSGRAYVFFGAGL